MRTIRAYHAPSGSILHAEVTDETDIEPRRSFRIIPDGLIEEVIIREGVWQITEMPS